METEVIKRRLVRDGVFLLLLGLLTGLAIPGLKNPRMGLSAHLEGILAGMFLILLGGVVWQQVKLSAKQSLLAFWLSLYGAYTTWAYTLLGAFWGTSRLTPIAGAGHTAPAWQETLVQAALASEVLTILLALGLVLYGLRAGASLQPKVEPGHDEP